MEHFTLDYEYQVQCLKDFIVDNITQQNVGEWAVSTCNMWFLYYYDMDQ